MTETATIEREITERIVAARLRLRFDKVVLRLIDSLKVALAEIVLEDQTVIFTLTAPIKRPRKDGCRNRRSGARRSA